MKKIIIAVAVLLVTSSTLFVACKKEVLQNSKSEAGTPGPVKKMGGQGQMSLVSFLASVDSIGALHNEGLDFFYDSLVASDNGNWIEDSVQLESFTKSVVSDFFTNKGISTSALFNMNIGSSIGVIPGNLSNQANAIVNTVVSAIDNYGNGVISFPQLISICQQQKQVSYGLQNSSESFQIGSCCAVAEYSAIYWKDNAEKYDALTDEVDTPAPLGIQADQKRVLKADAIGALLGPVTATAASCYMACKIAYERRFNTQ